jgi:hypothetical protein
MTRFQTTLSLSTLSLAGALFAMPLFSGGADASVTSQLLKCQFGTKNKVVSCCKNILHDNQRPEWMSQGHTCQTIIKCVGGGGSTYAATYVPANRRCAVYIPDNGGGDGGFNPQNPPRTPRGTFRPARG